MGLLFGLVSQVFVIEQYDAVHKLITYTVDINIYKSTSCACLHKKWQAGTECWFGHVEENIACRLANKGKIATHKKLPRARWR